MEAEGTDQPQESPPAADQDGHTDSELTGRESQPPRRWGSP
jgi:hypothetical protein